MSLTIAASQAVGFMTAAPIALTTPFAQAPNCADIFATTTFDVSSTFWANHTRTTIPVTFSNVADPRFAACQPPGWVNRPPNRRFEFSPAVCPSDWTAYRVGRTGASVTTAHCCTRY